MNKNILIICDSHGANYGCKSYSEILSNFIEVEVEIQKFPGLSIKKVLDGISINKKYDYIILQIGNPDIHPRMPKKLINRISKIIPSIAKDSLFSIPPVLSFKYYLRYPFFLIRRAVINNMKEKEYLVNKEELKICITSLVDICLNNSKKVFIFPVFNVDKIKYGECHNNNAIEINKWLLNEFPEYLIDSKIFKEDYYKAFYNRDYFHFKSEYHKVIADTIISIINERG